MTEINEARKALYDRFEVIWVAAHSTVPRTYDNEGFTPPASGPWVRFSVRHSSSRQETLGAVGHRNFERRGMVLVQVFIEKNAPIKSADTYVTTIKNGLEAISLLDDNLVTEACTPREIGPTERWVQTNVECPFWYTDTR